MIGRSIFASLTVLALASSPLSRAAFSAEPEVVDGIAALVHGAVVPHSQVRDLSGPREKLLRSQFKDDERSAKSREARQAALKEGRERQWSRQAGKKENG